MVDFLFRAVLMILMVPKDINECVMDPEDRECNFRKGDLVDHSIVRGKRV